MGVEATVCSAKGVTGYAVGVQAKVDDVTAALLVGDKMDSVKISAVSKLGCGVTGAAEAQYKVRNGDLRLTAGASGKMHNGHAAKVVVSSTGCVSSSYSGELAKGVAATVCLQVDQQVRGRGGRGRGAWGLQSQTIGSYWM